MSDSLLAVALVIESSLTVISEWHFIVNNYLIPLLQQLVPAYKGYQVVVSILAFGDPEEPPALRYFTPLSNALQELKGDLTQISDINAAGPSVNSLEGLIAALEVFDILGKPQTPSVTPKREIVSHLVCITATSPTSATRPSHNFDPSFDDVGWEQLPAEFKRRKINFNLLTLSTLPPLNELYASAAGDTVQQCRFEVRVPHAIQLSGFPVSQVPNKRVIDVPATEQPSEIKIPQSNTQNLASTNPGLSNAPTTSMSSNNQISLGPELTALMNSPINPDMMRNLFTRLKLHEATLSNLRQEHERALADELSTAESLKIRLQESTTKYNQFKYVVAILAKRMSLQTPQAQPSAIQWATTLNWTSNAPSGPHQVMIEVHTACKPECQPNTWPLNLTLQPTQHVTVSQTSLQSYVKRLGAAICVFTAKARNLNQTTNQASFSRLAQILSEKKIFASVAWSINGSPPTENMFLGAWSAVGLYAIVFPTTGIPEWPTELNSVLPPAAIIPPNPPASTMTAPGRIPPVPPEVMNQIMSQPAANRQQMYALWLSQQRQRQLSAVPQSMVVGTVNPAGFTNWSQSTSDAQTPFQRR